MFHKPACCCTNPVIEIVPESVTMHSTTRIIGISYESSCATARIPPIRAYLLLEPQPADRIPNAVDVEIESAKSAARLKSNPTQARLNGSTMNVSTVGTNTR